MGNTLNKVSNICNGEAYISIKDKETSILRDTQKRLKTLEGSEPLIEITKAVSKAMAENNHVVTEMCNTINAQLCKGWMSFKDKGEVLMNNFELEKQYIHSIKSNEDFICAYTLEEDINTIWIIIKDSIFKFNEKYFRSAREFMSEKNCRFNLVIFDEDEIDEIKEQLDCIEIYEVINK